MTNERARLGVAETYHFRVAGSLPFAVIDRLTRQVRHPSKFMNPPNDRRGSARLKGLAPRPLKITDDTPRGVLSGAGHRLHA